MEVASDRQPSPARRRRSARARLTQVARDMFAERGFVATSLDDVVAEAGVTKGSLYHHFASKTELFAAALEQEAERLFDLVVGDLSAEEDPWEAARAGIRAFLRASQDPGMQRIMFVDGPSALGWEGVREIESRYGLALIKASIETLTASGELRAHNVDVLAHLLFGALVEGALVIMRPERPDQEAVAVESEVLALLEGLRVRA